MPAIPPIVIDFAVRGMQDVSKAFETVEQRMRRFEQVGSQQAQAESEKRIRVARKEVDEREKAYQKMVRELEKEEERATKTAEKEAKKASDAVIKEAQRAAREQIREQERTSAEMNRMRQRAAEVAARAAAMQAAEEIKAAEKAQSAWQRVGNRIGGQVRHTVGGMLSSAAGMASTSLMIGGGLAVADAVHQELRAERSAALLVNQVTVGGRPPEGASVKEILGQASQVARETGMSREEVIEGTRAYAKTARGGDFRGAMANMSFFAKMAQTTGVDMGEIAGAAGMLQSQNAALAADPKKMQQMILDVYAQTKSGSLGMTEIISQMGRMGSVRGAFQGDETTNQRKLMALGQLVAPAAGAESGIMIADLALEATRGKHLEKAKAAGVKFDARNRIESPEQMISAILKSTNGDIGQIGEILGQRGGTLLRELAAGYTAARDAGGKGAAGIAAGDKYLKDTLGSVTSSTMTAGDLNQQFEQMMSTPAQRFTQAWEKVINTLEDKAEPYLEKFADALPQLLPKFEAIIDEAAKLAGWFADNPFKGMGAIVLAAITKDLAAAGIGAAVESVIARLIAKAGAGSLGGDVGAAVLAGGAGKVPLAALGKTGAGVALGAGAVGAAALVGGAIGYGASEALLAYQRYDFHGKTASDQDAANRIFSLNSKTRSGTVTAADIAAAQRDLVGIQQRASAANANAATRDRYSALDFLPGNREAHEQARAEARNFSQTMKLMQDAIQQATASVNHLGGAASEAANSVKGDPARDGPMDHRNKSGT